MDIYELMKQFNEWVKEILQDNYVGVYFHGSLRLGSFNPNKSDLDFIIVIKEQMDSKTKELIWDKMLENEKLFPKKGFEFSVVLEENCTNIKHPIAYELHGSRDWIERYKEDKTIAINDDYKVDPDLASHFNVINVPNDKMDFGKPSKEVFSKVPKEYIIDSNYSDTLDCVEEIVNNPEILINLLCEGLKMLWDIDINQYDIKKVSNIYERLKNARFNVENNLVDVNNVMPETFEKNGFSSPKDLLEWLENNIPSQDLVFTHGDFCFENIFAKNGHINGFIDLGKAGIADRWQDLAICIRELDDLNPNYSNLLLSKLGIEKDDFKLKYYMLLDELF